MPKIKIGNKIFDVKKEDLEKDEIVLEFEGTLRTNEEENSFVENHKKDARKEGEEIAVKEFREEYGFTGRKITDLIEGVKNKTIADAKVEPNEQIKKLQSQLTEKEIALQNALASVGEKENAFNSFKNQSLIDSTINGFIPENTILPKEDLKLIIKNKLSFDVENGVVITKDSSGNVIKNKTTADILPVKDVLENFFKDNQSYLKQIEGGRGSGDSGSGSGKQKLDDFIKEQQEKGISTSSEEFQTELNNRIKSNLVEVD